VSNLISNTGVVATDTTGVGTGRNGSAATQYGEDKGIFGYGYTLPWITDVNMSNKVSNVGVVASDTTGVGTARRNLVGCSYN